MTRARLLRRSRIVGVLRGLIVLLSLGVFGCAPEPPATDSAPAKPPPANVEEEAIQPDFPFAESESSLPTEFRSLFKEAIQTGSNGSHTAYRTAYRYRYATQGDYTAAIFLPIPIPRNDAVLFGAIADVVRRVYDADLSGVTPVLEPSPMGNLIAFKAGFQTYRVLMIKNETQEGLYGVGEPHTLLIHREAR